LISSFIYEIVPFPDEFWKRTELLRGKIRDNWEGESKPRQDLFLNFKELKNLYDKKGTRRIGCSGSRRVGFFCFRIVALFIIFLIQLSCLAAVDRGGHDTEKQEGTPRYALAENFVPVMNDPELPRIFGGKDGAQLSIDACGGSTVPVSSVMQQMDTRRETRYH
jgi:hypothetical protein